MYEFKQVFYDIIDMVQNTISKVRINYDKVYNFQLLSDEEQKDIIDLSSKV